MITYSPGSIHIRWDLDTQITEWLVEGMIAEGVGLAHTAETYREEDGSEGVAYDIVHVPSKTYISNIWHAESVEEMQRWIEQLNEVIDWTGEIPKVRAGKQGRALTLVAIGALHEANRKEEH